MTIKDDVIAGVVSGVCVTVGALGATFGFEARQNDNQTHLENLRFVRELALRHDIAMPFRGLDLEGVNLSGLDLGCRDKVSFEVCEKRADFQNASLRGADFSGTVLTGADFTGADLTDANLANADVSGALFLRADLSGIRDSQMCFTGATIWPAGYAPPKTSGIGPSEFGAPCG
jgi:uncharacterized protein YjbI with pentapeptide repeats